MSIHGWSRGDYTWRLKDQPFDCSDVQKESHRSFSNVRLAKVTNAASGDELELRTGISIHTSGDFDCRISFSKQEVALMAFEAFKAGTVEEMMSTLAGLIPVGVDAGRVS